ncbi:alpha-glucosidase-like isoform X2 [Babylonia areolata]|uniref:alpha-glucosidase-like isoform X2 n=1 Tax=Babylonia areolata TaxID=304850 RepID=UPI003FCFE1C0
MRPPGGVDDEQFVRGFVRNNFLGRGNAAKMHNCCVDPSLMRQDTLDSSLNRLPEDFKTERSNSAAAGSGGKEKAGEEAEDRPYRGMGKEDLLRHSGKPFWRRLRYICMSVVMVGWLALIITVVALVLIYPRCRSAPDQRWWKTAVVYRIYVRSFQDHDGDGIGDLDGIRTQLGYLKDIGVTTISLSPIYRTSPGSDSDTEVVNHTDIAPEYGTLFKFIRLVNSSHAHGIRVLMDFIPNHTGLDHPWFLESRNGTTNLKRNFYVWESGAGDNKLRKPNNWRSVYNESAWSIVFERDQYYLHQFQRSQPDLNLRSSEVKEQLQNVLKYWLDLGVDGFYIRDSGYLFEDYDIRDSALLTNESDSDSYDSYNHTYTYGRNEIHDVFARWRAFLDDYGNKTGRYKLLYADRSGAVQDIMQYYGHFNRDGVNFPLNTFCLHVDQSTRGQGVANVVRQWINSMPSDRWANWLGGTDSSPRLIDRLGEKAIRPFLTLIMLLPGTPVVYYGDEIGMSGLPVAEEVDGGQRNLSMRSPMQWDNTSHAGFCSCTKDLPWMTVNPRYSAVNVENQRADSHSLFYLFTNLTALRAQYNSFHYGDYNEAVVDDDVFSFVRDFDGEKGFLVALNFANTTVWKNYGGTYNTIPGEASVALRTGSDVKYNKGDKVSTSGLELGPHQGVVLSWDYVAKEL